MLPKTTEALDGILAQALPKLLSTVLSVKFWITVVTMIAGFAHGGLEGILAGTGAAGIYVGSKAYQNIQYAKLNGAKNGK